MLIVNRQEEHNSRPIEKPSRKISKRLCSSQDIETGFEVRHKYYDYKMQKKTNIYKYMHTHKLKNKVYSRMVIYILFHYNKKISVRALSWLCEIRCLNFFV